MRNKAKPQGLVFGTMSSRSSTPKSVATPQSLRIKSNVASQFGRSLDQGKPTTGVGFSGRAGNVLRRR